MSAWYVQMLCASAGPSADCYMPAVHRMLTEFKGKLDRPEPPASDAVVSSSSDSTLNYSYESNENENIMSLVPCSMSDSESE